MEGIPYTYESLVGKKNEIRLLRLRLDENDRAPLMCRLEHHRLDNPPLYGALSYVWKSPHTPEALSIDGTSYLKITASLKQALLDVRTWARNIPGRPPHEVGSFYVWADGVCINQQDLKERAEQILLMGDIYQRAFGGLIYTGPTIDPGGEFTEYLKYVRPIRDFSWDDFEDPNSPRNPFLYPSLSVMMDALRTFVRRSWPTRAWIWQEALLCKDYPTLLCGPSSLPFHTAFTASEQLTNGSIQHDMFLSSLQYRHPSTSSDEEDAPKCMLELLELKEELLAKPNGPKVLCLAALLRRCRRNHCTDPRDMVYCLANLASDWDALGIEIDYNTPTEQLYVEVASKIINRSRSFEILNQVGPAKLQLPSWVPDWTQPGKGSNLVPDTPKPAPTIHQFRAGGEANPAVTADSTNGTLRLQAYTFDRVHFLSHIFDNLELQVLGWDYFTEHHKDHLLPNSHYQTPEAVEEALWMTLTTARTSIGEKINPEIFKTDLDAWLRSQRARVSSETAADVEDQEIPADIDDLEMALAKIRESNSGVAEVKLALTIASSHRRWCTTADGRMGLVCAKAEVGDRICLVPGLQAPFIIRGDNNACQLVGDCYIHGVMEGELSDFESVTLEEIIFR